MTTGTYQLSRGIAAPAEPPASAELGIRLIATAIDGVLIGATAIIAAIAAHLVIAILPRSFQAAESLGLMILGSVVVVGYFTYFWGIEGTTPGKKMMGLCVTRPATLDVQNPIGVGRALLRLLGMTAGGLFFVDFIVAFLHKDRRALHDLMADSIVVARR
jgi:uncharacterized RDD family membrane protein YckC